LHVEAKALRPAGLALDLLVALLRRRKPQPAELVPAGVLARLAGQVGVEPDRVLHHLRQADRRAQLADEPGRVPGRAVGEAVLLDEDDVLPAEPGEVVEDAGAADPATDHDRLRLVSHGPGASHNWYRPVNLEAPRSSSGSEGRRPARVAARRTGRRRRRSRRRWCAAPAGRRPTSPRGSPT